MKKNMVWALVSVAFICVSIFLNFVKHDPKMGIIFFLIGIMVQPLAFQSLARSEGNRMKNVNNTKKGKGAKQKKQK